MFKTWPALAIGLAAVIFSVPAHADGVDNDILLQMEKSINPPSLEAQEGALRLTSNKNMIIRLKQDAASVIVNNPDHATVMLDSPRLLIIMPRLPGTTSFTVLDGNNQTILQKDIIVTNVQPQYVRIRKMCAGNDTSCVASAYYYCPDACYEVTPVAPQGSTATNIPAPAAAATGAAAGLAGGQNQEAPISNPIQIQQGGTP